MKIFIILCMLLILDLVSMGRVKKKRSKKKCIVILNVCEQFLLIDIDSLDRVQNIPKHNPKLLTTGICFTYV